MKMSLRHLLLSLIIAKKAYDITYAPVNNYILNYLEKVWGIKKRFVGSYSSDHETLQKYSYCNEYSTTVYRDDENWLGTILRRYEHQPIPDYHKWIISGEYHHLSYEQRGDLSHGPWDNCPELFLPEHITNNCFRAFTNPTSHIISAVSFLAWMLKTDVEQSYSEKHQSLLKLKVMILKRKNEVTIL